MYFPTLSAIFTLSMLASQCVAAVYDESITQNSAVTPRYARRHAKGFDVEKRAVPAGYTNVPMGVFRSGDAHSKFGTYGMNGCVGVAVIGTAGTSHGKLLAHVSPAGTPDHSVNPPVIPVGDFNAQIAAVQAYIQAHIHSDLQQPVVVTSVPASSGTQSPTAPVKAAMIAAVQQMCTTTGATCISPPHQRAAGGAPGVGEMWITSDNQIFADGTRIH